MKISTKRLAVITDTSIGVNTAFEPVVRELEEIHRHFNPASITWLGHRDSETINHVPISFPVTVQRMKCRGGRTLGQKLILLFHLPFLVIAIFRLMLRHDVIHTRGPSHPAIIAVALSFILKKKIYWNKYAGNWVQKSPPRSYAILRYLLKKCKFSTVTINGFWDGQEAHVVPFPNPTISDFQYRCGINLDISSKFSKPYKALFVGRVEREKGIMIILDLLNDFGSELLSEITIVGECKSEAVRSKLDRLERITYLGVLPNAKLRDVYERHDFLLLPSTASEGFPKVIAEAANYACIPVISNVASISHYVNENNGYVWDLEGIESYSSVLEMAFQTERKVLLGKAKACRTLSKKFTFSVFLHMLEKHVFFRLNI